MEPAAAARVARGALVVQVACGLLWAAATLRFGADWALPAYLVFFTSLLAISVIDFDLHIIPNRIVYPTIFVSVPLLAVAAAAEGDWGRLRHALIGAALAWLALLVIHLISPAGMGFGDVRLAFVLGLFLGWLSLRHVLTGMFLGFLLGAVIGVGLVLLEDPQPQGRRPLRPVPRRRAPSWPCSSATRSSAHGSAGDSEPLGQRPHSVSSQADSRPAASMNSPLRIRPWRPAAWPWCRAGALPRRQRLRR